MKIGVFKRAPFLIATGVIGLVCSLQVARHDFLERMERMTFDWRARQAIKFSPAVSTNLGYVSISDDSIDLVQKGLLDKRPYGLYWPRHIYGRLVSELDAEGAEVVAFDILFPDLRRDHDPLSVNNGQAVESDDWFAREIKAGGNVILASRQGVMPAAVFRNNALAIGDIDAEKDGDGILRRAKAFRMYRKWHRAFQLLGDDPEYAADLSAARFESNQIVLPRKILNDLQETNEPLIVPLNKDGNFDLFDFYGTNMSKSMARFDKPYKMERRWHMGIILAAQALKLDLEHAEVDLFNGRITLRGPNNVKRVLPVDQEGYFYIDWCLTSEDKRLTHVPIEALLSQYQVRVIKETNAAVVRLATAYQQLPINWHDKLVMVGSIASGNDLTDRGATPIEKETLLMSEHWNVANSVLTGRFISRSSLSVELFIIVILGSFAAWLTWFCRGRTYLASVWIGVAVVVYSAIAVFAYVQFRWWLPLILPVSGGLLTTHFCLLGYLVVFEQAERRRVRSVFAKVVSPDIVTELLKSEKLSLEGAQRNVTVFFSDIRGFTEMTDVNRAKAEELIKDNNLTGDAADKIRDEEARITLRTVNDYLSIVANMVLKNGGTVDKFIGDCVMAFWGAPVANPHHALHCVCAAIDVQREVFKFNQKRETENRQREAQNLMLAADGKPLLPMLPILVVGTGINTGVVTVGLMGSNETVNYTVFGREVNLASRLESVSGRSRIIISETTLAEILQDDSTLALSCKALPPEKVKGIRHPVPIYEVPWQEAGQTVPENPQRVSTEVYNTGYFTAGERKE